MSRSAPPPASTSRLQSQSFAHDAREALEASSYLHTAHNRRKAARLAALVRGRKTLARLKMLAIAGQPAMTAPHLETAICAIETLEAAVASLEAIAARLADARELVAAASISASRPLGHHADENDAGTQEAARAVLAVRYGRVRADIDRIARATHAGRPNLLDGRGDALDVALDAAGGARAHIPGINATSAKEGLALPAPRHALATIAERQLIARALATALKKIPLLVARFEVDAALLAARIRDLSA